MRVLVVDDEPAIGEIIARAIGQEHTVEIFSNAQEALLSLEKSEPYDLIFSDLSMPLVSGIDFYEKVIGKNPNWSSRFIFMTGGAYTKKAQDFLKNIPNIILDKPFSIAEIRKAFAHVSQKPHDSSLV